MLTGFEKIKEDFKKLIDNKRLSHAYLFFGGDDKNCQEKFIFSQSLANFLENGSFEESAKLLRETLIISPDEKGTIGIDNIRELKHFLCQKPINSARRIAIVKEAEKMTAEAQNAALKIVEEPPESALIIFTTDVADNLLSVLTSRLQKIHFSRPVAKKASANNAKDESIEEIIENNQIDEFFESLINDLNKNPQKNSQQLKEVLNRLVLMKQFNVNKKLQLRALISSLSE